MSNARIKITVPGEARGKGRPRFARRGAFVKTYTDEKTASYENLVAYCGNQAMAGLKPFDCALSVTVAVNVAPPASWSQKKKLEALECQIWPTSKPDLDNVIKGIFDALNGIAWDDDKQIVNVTSIKKYSDKPQVVIEFEPMDKFMQRAYRDFAS